MKHTIIQITIISACMCMQSCANFYSIKKEYPKKPLLQKYKTLYIGWLDLGKHNWKRYRYDTLQQWRKTIRDMNILGLHKYLAEFLPHKKIFGAKRPVDNFQAGSGLYIKIAKIWLSRHSDHMTVFLKCIDIKKQATVYTVVADISSRRSGFQAPFTGFNDMSFEGRLDNLVYNLAWFIYIKLNEHNK